MKKKMNMSLSILVASFVSLTPLYSPEASGSKWNDAEKRKINHVFTWGNPAQSSSVLHPGSASGAGMVKAPLEQIDDVITSAISQHVMPGAVTFVARSGHIVQHRAYGHALLYADDNYHKVDHPIAMKKNTIFDVASISKLFTTTAAMILYEEGVFQLDDPVAKYIPRFAANGKEEVTISQLMTHTSGFAAWIPLYKMGNSKEDRINIVLEHPLEKNPGSTYRYSDLNMITLGVLIEVLSGKTLDQFVNEKITQPLKMNDTMYNPPAALKKRIAATEYQPNTNRGLVWGEVHDENAWSLDGVAGHAGVFSTAADLAIFAHMFLNEGKYDGKRILQKETIQKLVENQIPAFPGNEHGLGWELFQSWFMDALSEETTLGHTGYTGTSIVVSPNNQTIAILLTNRVHPTRETVSTNGVRRQFARQVAEAIPVTRKAGKKAWFSGYGDNANYMLETEVHLPTEATLSFQTWYLLEENSDYGYVEISQDGEKWEKMLTPFTGSSEGWKQINVPLPKETNYIRFHYQTDETVNGRGWYVNDADIQLKTGAVTTPIWNSDHWVERAY